MSVNSHSHRHDHSRRSPRQRRSRATVAAILDAAAQVFGERGYRATTTNHVAARAGVSIGSLYQYFPHKDALLVAIELDHLEVVAAAIGSAREQWAADPPTPHGWATSFSRLLVDLNDSDVHRIVYDNAPRMPAVAERTDQIVGTAAEGVRVLMRHWRVADEGGHRSRTLVVAAVATVHEVVIRTPRGTRRRNAERALRDVLAAGASPDPGPAVASGGPRSPG